MVVTSDVSSSLVILRVVLEGSLATAKTIFEQILFSSVNFKYILHYASLRVIVMGDKILPLAAMERLMKKAAPDVRVSDPAKEELRIALEEHGVKLGRIAAEYSAHAGRKTIKAEDIKMALKR